MGRGSCHHLTTMFTPWTPCSMRIEPLQCCPLALTEEMWHAHLDNLKYIPITFIFYLLGDTVLSDLKVLVVV